MLANGLSLARILLAPVVAWSLYVDGPRGGGPVSGLTLGLMLAAGATDGLDGWAARRLGQASRLGRILDPLADKLFIGCVCVSLVWLRGFPAWLVALQAGRDLAIVAVGGFLLRSRRLVIPASRLGKAATWAMALTILTHVLAVGPPSVAHALTAGLILLSAADYLRQLRTVLATAQPAVESPRASTSSRTEA